MNYEIEVIYSNGVESLLNLKADSNTQAFRKAINLGKDTMGSDIESIAIKKCSIIGV